MNFVQTLVKSKTKFKIGTRWLALSGILTVASFGCWLIYVQNFRKSGALINVPITEVKRHNLELTVDEGGILELGNQQSLKAPGEVTVEKVLVKVRDRVKAGQKLLILRNKEQQDSLANKDLEIRKQEVRLTRDRQKVAEAEKNLALAQKEFREPIDQQLEIDKREIDLIRTREKVTQIKERLTVAQKKLKSTQALFDRGFISRDELEGKETELKGIQLELRNTKLELKTSILDMKHLKTKMQERKELREKVLQAKSALEEARLNVNNSISELKRLRVEREVAAKKLKNNIVSAPINGKLLDVKVKDGEGVTSGKVLMTLGDPTTELVKLNIGTLDAGKVKVGQVARVKVIGPKSQEFSGKVNTVHPQAVSRDDSNPYSFMGGGSSGQVLVPATIELDKPTGVLIPGSNVSVTIVVEERKKVVAVNLEAVKREEGKPFVWVIDKEGKARKRKVTLGIEGASQVEVKSGLKVGEKVIIPAPDTILEEGASVQQ
ncbi:MAG: efflux RND transporter periplasmic adaptor subunit [Mastigocoleus sp. MO_167.B18]|uniref:efflux RND transporter periplasmic adaptor subunit n=1 Tax=Mastigocoleus sp. MO_188.B34 TaxID=3036635 RepID=UPI0026207987|nr:efflux RND transporter periplasmic adaptor subunit [Mastigocoleus sp. MO_188.B34]MDJ0696014.1 efflux RND transporter periplasmic adaptor subunit [Mastigocoleus sp. MO_188.B34]MDJ0772080.1 efflux RND transporter periplasmic adaptor subunit [Mastigocoleus sp. MO_167.B18]